MSVVSGSTTVVVVSGSTVEDIVVSGSTIVVVVSGTTVEDIVVSGSVRMYHFWHTY